MKLESLMSEIAFALRWVYTQVKFMINLNKVKRKIREFKVKKCLLLPVS